MVVYGGRNDDMYQHNRNVALNDICMFNVNKREWIAIAMYGMFPNSRWAHCLATEDIH